jgi:DNA (cytosine-5)-methyltransferase 1
MIAAECLRSVPSTSYRIIDLFSGCGGMTRGFVECGRFQPICAVEVDRDAAETYRRNFGEHVLERTIQNVIHVPQADVVIGGPPCQGFSTLNRRGVGLERRALWEHYFRVLVQSGAEAFVMENVPQLLSSEEFAEFQDEAQAAGFHLTAKVLLAADFGVPQLRRRAIVMGSKFGPPPLPARTHGRPDGELPEWPTFRWATQNPTPLSLVPDGVRWHRGRNPTAVSVERYKTIPKQGEGRFQLAERRPDITPPCWLRKTTGTTDVFGRLWWDKPSSTIRTEFVKPEKGRYLHPQEHRPITVREAARCMSFPDDFELPEEQSMTSVARQIGNAVPPLLARRIAEALADHLDSPEPDKVGTDRLVLASDRWSTA